MPQSTGSPLKFIREKKMQTILEKLITSLKLQQRRPSLKTHFNRKKDENRVTLELHPRRLRSRNKRINQHHQFKSKYQTHQVSFNNNQLSKNKFSKRLWLHNIKNTSGKLACRWIIFNTEYLMRIISLSYYIWHLLIKVLLTKHTWSVTFLTMAKRWLTKNMSKI